MATTTVTARVFVPAFGGLMNAICTIKDDFQSVLRSLRTLMFINIINGSLDGMRIDVIR